MFIYFPGQAGRLPFNAPLEMCCNCGTAQGLWIVDTPLVKTRYLLLAGTEITFQIELPHCGACRKSAKRFPAGLGKKLLVSAMIFAVLMLVVAVAGIDFGGLIPVEYRPHAVGVLSLALSFGFFALRRAKKPQTSYSQSVTLAGLKQKFSGEIVSLTLGFSNAAYADRFSAANADFVSAGALKIVRPT